MPASERDSIHRQDAEEAPPSPSAMIESMRAFGYSLATAIADLIDNSITARAKNVWIEFHWGGRDSYITIADDGCGMSEPTLRDAMRLGSRSPLATRDKYDLGRFSIGMKTASLSQCRRLTVASMPTSEQVAIRRWDLDYLADPSVDGWSLLKSAAPGSDERLAALEQVQSGTVVLWERMDRIVGDVSPSDVAARGRFLAAANAVEEHLGMVFHRFLSPDKPKLRIFLNGQHDDSAVRPWDPFIENHPATTATPEETLRFPDGDVQLRGFILPHKDRLTTEEHKLAAGPAGWNAQQGFYVYRGDRLLVPGSWLGLGKPRPWTKEEHYKLARISIAIPNSMDLSWQIDVRKSIARPPSAIRDRLRELADSVRKDAREVYAHRGSYGPRKKCESPIRLWNPVTRAGQRTYRIDREHALVRAALALDAHQDKRVGPLLRVLEETVPVQQIWLDTAESPDQHATPFQSTAESEVRRAIEDIFRVLTEHEGMSPDDATSVLARMDAFRDYRAIIYSLVDD